MMSDPYHVLDSESLSASSAYLLVGGEVVEGVVEHEVVRLGEGRQVQLPLRLVHHHRLRRLRLDDVRVACTYVE